MREETQMREQTLEQLQELERILAQQLEQRTATGLQELVRALQQSNVHSVQAMAEPLAREVAEGEGVDETAAAAATTAVEDVKTNVENSAAECIESLGVEANQESGERRVGGKGEPKVSHVDVADEEELSKPSTPLPNDHGQNDQQDSEAASSLRVLETTEEVYETLNTLQLGDGEVGSEPWQCTACTFVNMGQHSSDSCEVCATHRAM
jgi:rubrerythrin